MPRKTKHSKNLLRSEIALLKIIERSNESLFGGEEYAARIRRYVASHDAPQDDRTAFGRLCAAVFAQGLGFEVVERHRAALEDAFHEFNPSAVAAIDDERVEELMREPIIRNKPKIIACVENAKRWSQLASLDGSYLARVAKIAAEDNPGAGWPKLIETLRGDFRRLGEPTARMTLKRWGFFTAAVHPGSQRLLQRLNVLKDEADDMGVQRFVVSLAQVTGTDPYALEAALAIFAANGPCKPKPVCAECRLQTECPSAKMALAAS